MAKLSDQERREIAKVLTQAACDVMATLGDKHRVEVRSDYESQIIYLMIFVTSYDDEEVLAVE